MIYFLIIFKQRLVFRLQVSSHLLITFKKRPNFYLHAVSPLLTNVRQSIQCCSPVVHHFVIIFNQKLTC
jgi:hypothetical protein